MANKLIEAQQVCGVRHLSANPHREATLEFALDTSPVNQLFISTPITCLANTCFSLDSRFKSPRSDSWLVTVAVFLLFRYNGKSLIVLTERHINDMALPTVRDSREEVRSLGR